MNEVQQAMDVLEKARIFPLQTLQSMAIRWGFTKQMVQNYKRRDKEFPRALVGIVAETKRTAGLYPLFEVERYERVKGFTPK